MRRIEKALMAAVVALLLCACGSKVHYLDNDDVEVTDVKEVEDGDHLVVHLQFKNQDTSAVNHSVYRVEWFDGDDHPLEATSWRPLILRGGVTAHATERCTKPGAKNYKIVITNDAR